MAVRGRLGGNGSDRAARALTEAFHRARQSEGLTAWAAPNIFDWKSFVHTPGTNAVAILACCSTPRRKSLSGRKSPVRNALWPRCSKARATGWPVWPWRRTSCSALMHRNFCARKPASAAAGRGGFQPLAGGLRRALPLR